MHIIAGSAPRKIDSTKMMVLKYFGALLQESTNSAKGTVLVLFFT